MGENLTPGVLAKKLRENMNNNGTLKSLFATQFLSKMEINELQGLMKNIEVEFDRRKEEEIERLRIQLDEMGYNIVKK
jgi:hypothetical protein